LPLLTDSERLGRLAEATAAQYAAAQPFPHAVFDDFLPLDVLHELQAAFPGPEDASWGTFANKREVKLALNDEAQMPQPLVQMLREVNSQEFVAFLRKLTGHEDLVPDPDYYGGGLHQISPGGVLKVHADFNLHPVTRLVRQLNVILYLNDDWDDSYGGHLELWDEAMTHPVKRIAPVANRLLVFSTTSSSFHGHPDPLACPPGRTRKSMAWFFYSMPHGRVPRHTALFQSRPGETLYTKEEARQQKIDRWAGRVMSLAPTAIQRTARRVAASKRD
jgi:Rps23 Pro-64 3,4-dihydroxylase Tpa1-like proline 4-hydroxylase